MNSYTDDFERWYYEWLAQRQAGGRPSSINAARAAWAAARAWDKLSTPCGPNYPAGAVVVSIKRPEGYEDVAAELVAVDALDGIDFDWELLTDPNGLPATHDEGSK